MSYTKQINQMEAFEEGQSKEIDILEKDYTEAVDFRYFVNKYCNIIELSDQSKLSISQIDQSEPSV